MLVLSLRCVERACTGNSATKICQQGPVGEDGKPTRPTMADVQTYFQDLCVIASTGFRLPTLMSDWTHLFLVRHNNLALLVTTCLALSV